MTEAEKCLDNFLQCWKKNAHSKALQYCQKTWIASSQAPKDFLKNLFSMKLISFNIIAEAELAPMFNESVVCDLICLTKLEGIKKPQRRVARLMKEKKAYDPDPNGEWGVNPISILRVIKIKEL